MQPLRKTKEKLQGLLGKLWKIVDNLLYFSLESYRMLNCAHDEMFDNSTCL